MLLPPTLVYHQHDRHLFLSALATEFKSTDMKHLTRVLVLTFVQGNAHPEILNT